MKEETRQNLVRSDIWTRVLFMILFAVVFSFAKMATILVAIFQFFTILVTGNANEHLLQFGKNLAAYVYEILEFQTFNTEIHPFPFSPWPDEEHGGDAWLEDELEDEENTDEVADDAAAEDTPLIEDDSAGQDTPDDEEKPRV